MKIICWKYYVFMTLLLGAILACQIFCYLKGILGLEWLQYLFWLIMGMNIGVLLRHYNIITED